MYAVIADVVVLFFVFLWTDLSKHKYLVTSYTEISKFFNRKV